MKILVFILRSVAIAQGIGNLREIAKASAASHSFYSKVAWRMRALASVELDQEG